MKSCGGNCHDKYEWSWRVYSAWNNDDDDLEGKLEMNLHQSKLFFNA